MLLNILKPELKAYLLVGLLAFSGCDFGENPEVHTLNGYALGTSYSVKVVGTLSDVRGLEIGIEGVLSDINSRMSTYLPDSDVSRIETASVGEWMDIAPSTAEVINEAIAIAKETNGAFDPTVAPLVDLWGFGPDPQNSQVPADSEIMKLLAQVGFEGIEVTESAIKKLSPRSVDLSAIAKGYAVDQVASHILDAGFDRFMVEVGGEMRFSGKKPKDESWKVAIESPEINRRAVYEVLAVPNGAMATSGDYRNYFEQDGHRYSHTIDPKTGYPITHALASVTVFTEMSMHADAYATAMLVMGPEDALKLANSRNLAAFLIVKQEGEFQSVASKRFIELFGEQLSDFELTVNN